MKPGSIPSHSDIYIQKENQGYGYKAAELVIAVAQLLSTREDIAFSSLPEEVDGLKDKSILTSCISIDISNPNGPQGAALILKRAREILLDKEKAPKQIIIPIMLEMPSAGINHYSFFVMKPPAKEGETITIEYINSRGADFTSENASAHLPKDASPSLLKAFELLRMTDFATTTIPEALFGITPSRNTRCFQPGMGWCSVVTTEAIMEFLKDPKLTAKEFDSKAIEYRECNSTKADEVVSKHPQFIGLREHHGNAFHEFSEQHPVTRTQEALSHGGDFTLVDLLMRYRQEMMVKFGKAQEKGPRD